ncbi:MAG: M23 family metallopeptidase [Candidatus Cloacimonetes bacterium]|nr:M23 family metallopeptidase [Candidatus Cloacimonadota bacterium]
MSKFCCYLLILLLLLFFVYYLDNQKVVRELKQQEKNISEPIIPEKETAEKQDLRQLLEKYLQSARYSDYQQVDSLIANRFLPEMPPVKGEIFISQPFSELHQGVDIALPEGDIVYAAAAGKVIKAAFDEYFGNLIIIDHLNGYNSFYGHLSEIIVDENYFIEKEAPIGLAGSTGFSTASHLHFSISKNQKFIDPEELWKQTEKTTSLN